MLHNLPSLKSTSTGLQLLTGSSKAHHSPIRFLRLVVLVAFVFAALAATWLILPALAVNDGRPDVIWMRGGHNLDIRSMDYSPDGQLFVSMGDNNGVVKIWRLSDGMLLRTFNVFAGTGYEVKFLPDSQTIVVTGFESSVNYIKRVSVSDGQTIWSVPGVYGVRIDLTSGGDLFLSGNGPAQFYRSSDGALLESFSHAFYRNSNGEPINWGGFVDGYLADNGNVAVSLNTGSGGNYYPAIIDPNDCYTDAAGVTCHLVAYFPSLSNGTRGITPDGSYILTALST